MPSVSTRPSATSCRSGGYTFVQSLFGITILARARPLTSWRDLSTHRMAAAWRRVSRVRLSSICSIAGSGWSACSRCSSAQVTIIGRTGSRAAPRSVWP
ncbi:hypothetical protein Smic_07550 [Streptomyces microflavus]|uniref:Uncharacterized protein n=1 Tax=Streptomyces microflavus TaxID=1919 RepID=A0A7J0CIF8_STRMI|nr:hypothetical protein Smic_07550 [Streptomyces microflavus]